MFPRGFMGEHPFNRWLESYLTVFYRRLFIYSADFALNQLLTFFLAIIQRVPVV